MSTPMNFMDKVRKTGIFPVNPFLNTEDPVYMQKVKEVFQKMEEDRTDADLELCYPLLMKLPFIEKSLEKYPVQLRKR